MRTWVDVACYLSFLYKPYQKKNVPKYYTPVALHYTIRIWNKISTLVSTNISQTLNPNTSFKSQWSTYPNRTNEFGNIPLGARLGGLANPNTSFKSQWSVQYVPALFR